MLTNDAYSFGQLVLYSLGLAYVLLVETNPFPELVLIFSRLFTSNMPWYFLDFALGLSVARNCDLSHNLHCMNHKRLGVSQYIDISQYTKNLYHIAIRNLYRNISRFFFLFIRAPPK